MSYELNKKYIAWDDNLCDTVILEGRYIEQYDGELEHINLLSDDDILSYLNFLRMVLKYKDVDKITIDCLYNEIKFFKLDPFKGYKLNEVYYTRFEDEIHDIKDPEVYNKFISSIKGLNNNIIEILY